MVERQLFPLHTIGPRSCGLATSALSAAATHFLNTSLDTAATGQCIPRTAATQLHVQM